MKIYEKVLRCLMLPFMYLWHGVKKIAKPTIAMLMAITMVLSVLPITAFGTVATYSIMVGGVDLLAEMTENTDVVYYQNGGATFVNNEPNGWNARLTYGADGYTLTIKDLSVVGKSEGSNAQTICGIYSDYDLTLDVQGTNTVTGGDGGADQDSYGIYLYYEDLTVKGNGILTATGGASNSNYGIFTGSIDITGVTLNANGGVYDGAEFSYGIYANYSITVQNATLNANGGDARTSYGICGYAYSDGFFEIGRGAEVYAKGGDTGIGISAGISSPRVITTGGQVTAQGGNFGTQAGGYVGKSYGLNLLHFGSILTAGSFTGKTNAIYTERDDVLVGALGHGFGYYVEEQVQEVTNEDNYVGEADKTVTVNALSEHSITYAVNPENPLQIIESCNCGSHNETATLEIDTSVSTVYTGSAIMPLKVTYSEGWVGGKPELSYSGNINAGTANGSLTIGGATVTKNFEITRSPVYSLASPTAQGITYGAKLSAVTLTDGWTWADGNIIPTVENQGYTACYTPADTANYDWTAVEGWVAAQGRIERTVSVAVAKADPEYTVPTGVTATYGDTLANVNISDWGSGWSWKNATINVGNLGTNHFVAIFVPTDTDNYNTVEVDVTVTVYPKALNGANVVLSDTEFTYNGNGQTPTIRVTCNGNTLIENTDYDVIWPADCTNAGQKTITVTFKGNYSGSVNRTYEIKQKELQITWGNSAFVYDGTEKFPEFTVDGIVPGDEVIFTREGVQINASETACTATIRGITGSAAGNYKLPNNVTQTFTVDKASQSAPTGLGKTDETISKKADGTITGIAADMEYRKDGENTYTGVNSSGLENLAAGTYYVRYQEKGNYHASPDTAITVNAGSTLAVTLPTGTEGYTVTADKAAYDYGDAVTLSFAFDAGYGYYAEALIIKHNGNDISEDYSEAAKTVTFVITEDTTVTVEGVQDTVNPTVEIELNENRWNTFWNTVTFGLFFKETQTVTINASDVGSGVDKVYYYISDTELTLPEAISITEWEEYTEPFHIDPEANVIVYAYAVDKSGRRNDANSAGIVLDATAPGLYGIENGGVYYGDKIFKAIDDHFLKIEIDGLDVTDTTQGDDEYKIVADNAEHTVTVTDKAGNVTEYTLAVMKNYTVTYKIDGETVGSETVGYGKDATAPAIPEKSGYNETAPKWDSDGKNITADTVINAVYTKNDPGEYTVSSPETNVGGGKLTESAKEVKKYVPFTEEELKQVEHGADVEIWLEVKDISNSVSAEDKAKIAAKLGDAKIAMYLDISMFKQVGENEASRLTQLSGKVTVSFRLPDSYINTDTNVTRTYQIIHVHDGKTEVITPVFDAQAKTLTFLTDRFSTYAVVYTDVTTVPPAEETTPPAQTPATGDKFSPVLWATCMLLSMVAVAVLLIGQKKRNTAK